jgi:hypothetical protein
MMAGMKTTIKVDTTTRDKLAAVADGRSMDQAINDLIWEHELARSLAEFDADPGAAAEARAEARQIAEATVADGLDDVPAWEHGA